MLPVAMRDFDIRLALRQSLQEEFSLDPNTRIIEELGICQGSIRIDLAVANCLLHGYELKSAADTLERLPAQAEAYSKTFDRVTLVTASRHLEPTLSMVPTWWGIVRANEEGRNAVTLEVVRAPGDNPGIDPSFVVQLLWRDEALALLEHLGWAKGIRSKPREHLWQRLVEVMPMNHLCEHVRNQLKSRQGWRAAAPPL